jgi:ribosomal protein S4
MRHTPSLKLKKNSKLIRLSRLILSFFMGGLKAHQLKKLYKMVSSKHRFLNLLITLESRLEFFLYKAGFVLTGKQARQLILHGQIYVNYQPVTAYNYSLHIDDILYIDPKSIPTYKSSLICQLWGTSLFFNFLKQKCILKKPALSQMFLPVRFPCFLESNFKTFSTYLVRKPVSQECFLPNIVTLGDLNQLYFVL